MRGEDRLRPNCLLGGWEHWPLGGVLAPQQLPEPQFSYSVWKNGFDMTCPVTFTFPVSFLPQQLASGLAGTLGGR